MPRPIPGSHAAAIHAAHANTYRRETKPPDAAGRKIRGHRW
jgi:hypothetical protein